MYRNREFGCLVGTIAQAEGCQHISFGGDTHTRAATLQRLHTYLLPQLALGAFHIVGLGVRGYLE